MSGVCGGGYYGGFGWRSLLIFLLVIATIFVFVCCWGGYGGGYKGC